MKLANRNVAVLSGCQGLLHVNNSILMAVTGLAGHALASNKALATLPLTMYFVGAMISTIPISLLMRRIGRRGGFILGALCAIAGALTCAAAVYAGSFWLLCGGILGMGIYFAGGQYYRFAAADAAAVEAKSRAISLVLAGGLIGGFVGPETSKLTIGLVARNVYVGPYLSLVFYALLAIVMLRLLHIPRLSEAERRETGRPLSVIARQPSFIVAVLCAMICYGVMTLLMAATPLAMIACRHPFSDAAFVIQWHMVGMFAPSFFTGSLILRFGLLPVMFTGVALNLVCVAIAVSGVEVMNFWLALMLLGVGWNFMFIGATTLLTETHTPAERAKVQGVNDAAIFATLVASSLASGVLFSFQGWQAMNYYAIPVLVLAGSAILWLAAHRRQPRQARPPNAPPGVLG